MSALTSLRAAALAAVVAGALGAAAPSFAQTVGTRITVGTNPTQVAMNPFTRKLYVANKGSDTVTVIDANTGATSTITLPAPAVAPRNDPTFIAVNAETNSIYVSNLTSANSMLIDGTTDTVTTTMFSGGGGWTAINPYNDTAYVIRFGTADEVNVIEGDRYELTFATRSHEPVALAVNPVNNRIFVANRATGDIAALDVTTPVPYPRLLCPDGSGGFRPQPAEPPTPPAPDPYNLPCIDVPNPPVSVAINPLTNFIYALSDSTSAQISVINGNTHTFTSLTPPGGLTGAKTIAVDPVANKIYAAFSTGIVVIDGATNGMTFVASGSGAGGPAAIGINVLTGTVYVPNKDGTMLIRRPSGATATVSIAANANGIAVDPLTNSVFVLDSGGGVTPVTDIAAGAVSNGITTNVTPLPGNTSGSGGTITLNASSTMAPAPFGTVRRVYYRVDNQGAWQAAARQPDGSFTAVFAGLAPGSHTLRAIATNGLEAPSINTDLANVPIVGNIAQYTFNVTSVTPAQAVITPSSLSFGGQSMGTSSLPQDLTVTNIGSGTLTFSSIATSAQFANSHNCSSLAEGQSCTVTVRFTPTPNPAAALNATAAVNGTVSLTSNGAGSPNAVNVSGTSEKSLVTHYYRSILARAPDSGGFTFWSNEAARVAGLGANVNEAWFAMAATFYASAEYTAFNRNDQGFVEDLYNTFFNRPADSGGLAFWMNNITGGMPREVVLVSFMFSAEFQGFTQAIFGNTAVRAELDVVGDFYRGALARLPDDGGFAHWVQRFRTAQCQGAAQVRAQADQISQLFFQSPEYVARNRTNKQYIGDLYNSFLRRGGDLEGVNFWVNRLNTLNRDQVRREFLNSPEFTGRVNAIISQGCIQ